MLRRRGVKGREEKLTEVINRYKGHALSLTSLAGYLNRYYDGDINQAPEVEFVLSDGERFKDVNKLLRKYAEKMSASERIFLNIFSLFRQEVTENYFAGVFRHKPFFQKESFTKEKLFNDVLVKMSELDFRDMINGLVDWRLISYDETKKTYATHPLIKGYFESDFEEKNKKLCHKHIYQYFGEYAPEWLGTLEKMQPLFEQVYHGCAAGLYDEVCAYVYWARIRKRDVHFITHILGAWETDLSLAKTFFPEGDFSQMPLVSKKNAKAWLLAVAGLALLNTGRPKEAEQSFVRHINMNIKDKDWKHASVGYVNLVDLQFRTGALESGLESAKKALDAAKKAQFDTIIVNSKAYLAWIFHLLGRSEEAKEWFKDADELEGKISGYRLYSWNGVFYTDFLLSMKRLDEASELVRQNLEISHGYNWPDVISRCHRLLGAIERIKGNHNEAEIHRQNALEIARKVGMPALEIEALLESSRLYLDMGKHEDAIRDAKEALKICVRTGFKLYEPKAEIVLSKAYMALNDIEQAKSFAQWAYEKAVTMNYRWAEGDVAHLLGEIHLKEGDKMEASEWLEKAVACRQEILDPEVEESETILEGL
ncbi:MAG: tetratricopeptide repeat protein [Proteobacteria bacterium]|nr:tetratricopeptide repeat protein [Pseudomonadota bacterium]